MNIDIEAEFNEDTINFIMIHGGKPETVEMCHRAYWYYGTQFGYTCYGLPWMVDYTGDGSDWDKYMDFLRSHRPRQALVMDFRNPQTEWRECTRRMRDVAELNIRPVVVHKSSHCLRLIPEYVLGVKSIIGVSVPTQRGYMNDGDGTMPTRHEIKQHSAAFYDSSYKRGKRDIHLLGGQPDQWAYLIQYYKDVANVVSIDGNSLYEQAREYGKLWSRHGFYKQLPSRKHSSTAIASASMRNARRFLKRGFYHPSTRITLCKKALGQVNVQMPLFEEARKEAR